jgi:hypothetical protein
MIVEFGVSQRAVVESYIVKHWLATAKDIAPCHGKAIHPRDSQEIPAPTTDLKERSGGEILLNLPDDLHQNRKLGLKRFKIFLQEWIRLLIRIEL